MSANNKVIAALTTGAVLGAAAGLLLAPNPGRETRKVVASHSGELRHKAGHYITNLKGNLRRKESKDHVGANSQDPTE